MDEELADRVAGVEGVVESRSQFKDVPAFWVNGTEIAHLETDDRLDVRLTRRLISLAREQLRDDPAVELRRNSADWLTVDLSVPGGADRALELVEQAAAAHRALPGQTPRPPRH